MLRNSAPAGSPSWLHTNSDPTESESTHAAQPCPTWTAHATDRRWRSWPRRSQGPPTLSHGRVNREPVQDLPSDGPQTRTRSGSVWSGSVGTPPVVSGTKRHCDLLVVHWWCGPRFSGFSEVPAAGCLAGRARNGLDRQRVAPKCPAGARPVVSCGRIHNTQRRPRRDERLTTGPRNCPVRNPRQPRRREARWSASGDDVGFVHLPLVVTLGAAARTLVPYLRLV